MLVRRYNDGTYYLCQAKKGDARRKLNRDLKRIWFVKYTMSKSGEIYMNHRNVSIPKELIGKKIMFRVEIDERRSVRAEER